MEIDNGWEVFGMIMIMLIIFFIGFMVGITETTERAVTITEQYYGNATKEYFVALLTSN